MSNTSLLLPFRKKGNTMQFLVKNEYIAGWDAHPDVCGILNTVTNDLYEKEMLDQLKLETDIIIDSDELIRLGVCAIKRNSDLVCYLYSADLSKRNETIEAEMDNYLWISEDRLMQSIDAQLLSAYARLKFLLF
ncbi:hypothetical protein QE109_04220 [Fusibacter bizertensis]|uniref:Nudix hydrolase domain-containing protein n=1 Tax=Fusibacter bizertensis TaxID=1488331 RepID=A0ABT6NAA7_9FIRM|nr:hypothetical protein [Fusibacter bizertensis]MDH8677339.1 hypothetical protein [Fusibacter bizertensis]